MAGNRPTLTIGATRDMPANRPLSRALLAAAVASLALVALPGCQTQPRAVAHVGDRIVTEAQFQAAAATIADRIFLPADSAKAVLLDNLEQRELLLVAARNNPALPDSYMTRRRKEIEDEALWRALLAQLTPATVGVSDAEVKQLYLWRQQSTHCQLILTTEPTAAGAARVAVDAGEDFSAVANRFDVTSTLPPGGDLGFIEAGALVDPLDRIVRETPVGAIAGPIETPGQGWFIVKIVARQPHEQASFDTMEKQLRGMLEQRKQRIALSAQYASLRNQYNIVSDPQGLNVLYQRLNAMRAQQQLGVAPDIAPPGAQERATVIGRWDGGAPHRGALTIGEAIDDLNNGRASGLNPARLDAYDEWVKNIILQRVAIIEARRRHLNEEPKTAEHIKQAIEEVQLQAVLQTEVRQRAEPNDAEIYEVYERNAPAFAQLKSVNVQYMTLPESALAVRAAEQAARSGTLKDAVMLSSASFSVKEEVLHFPTTDPFWQMLQPALTQQRVGGMIGPVQLADGWRIVQLIARDAPIPAFANLTPEQQNGIKQQSLELASERRLKAFTDSLRTVVPVIVDRKRFKRIVWPGPNVIPLNPGAMGQPGS